MKTGRTAFDVEALRSRFPALSAKAGGKRLVYLDNACTALKSKAVAEAAFRFYRELGACGGRRSTHWLAQAVEAQAQQAREAVAEFLGADSPNEIVFTSGVTEAANLLARAFPFNSERREVVLSDLEHNAVFLPFFEAARREEIELRICRTKDGRLDPAALEPLVTERTALVALTRASNVAGGVQPMAEACRLAHRFGALVFADDAQFVCSHREDVSALDVDFAAFSAHKIGGPFGIGALYGKQALLNDLRHYKVGGGAVKAILWNGEGMPEVRYLDAPQRFEPGVANFAAFAGLSQAIALLRAVPEAALRAHVSSLVRRLLKGLSRLPQLRVVGKAKHLEGGSLVSFYPTQPDFSLPDFNLFLNHELAGRYVAVRTGEHCAHLLHSSLGIAATMRVSFFAYNTAEEVDLFLAALRAYLDEAL